MDQEVLARLADELYEIWTATYRAARMRRGQMAYKNYRPAASWSGVGKDKRGKPNVNAWARAARLLSERGIEFAPFVTFVICEKKLPNPTPAQLYSERIVTEYEETNPRRQRVSEFQIQLSFDNQRQILARQLDLMNEALELGFFSAKPPTPHQIRESLLTDESLELTALFRFCLAESENLNEISQRYYERAAAQYATHASIYNKVWGKWLPRWFREKFSQS